GDPECPAAPAASPDPGTDSQPLLVWPAALSGIAGDPARPGLPGPAPGACRPTLGAPAAGRHAAAARQPAAVGARRAGLGADALYPAGHLHLRRVRAGRRTAVRGAAQASAAARQRP